MLLIACNGEDTVLLGGHAVEPGSTEAPGPAVDDAPSQQPAAPDAPVTPAPGAGDVPEDYGPPDYGAGDPLDLPVDPVALDDVLALGVRETLQVYCGDCHAPGGSGPSFGADVDFNELIESGLIIAGAGRSSRLFRSIADGRMPPPTRARTLSPTAGDLELLARFIDQLPIDAGGCGPAPVLGLDAVNAAMLADVQRMPAEDRPFIRYFRITPQGDACTGSMLEQRMALAKLVNSVSLGSNASQPLAIDAGEQLYRVDIRHYDWARALDVDGDGVAEYASAWDAIVANAGPYALEVVGPEASALGSETGTLVPVLPVQAFIRAAGVGELYYALTGVPRDPEATLPELWPEELLDEDASQIQRAAAARPGPLGDVVVTRYAIHTSDAVGGSPAVASARRVWLADVQDEVRDGSIYDDPTGGINADWAKLMIELPNGMYAFALSGGSQRLGAAPRRCSTCAPTLAINAIACMACHAQGLLPVEDIMIERMTELAPIFVYGERELAVAELLYPPAREFAQLVSSDSSDYSHALERSGVTTPADPVSRAYLHFDEPLTLERAAAELGVPASGLAEQLDTLPAAFASFAEPSTTLDRAAFSTAYLDAVCALESGSRNRPRACP